MRLPRLRFRRRADTGPARPKARRSDKFGFRDLMAEASYSIGARPGRLFLTILGTILGIGSVVVTVGMAQTTAGQINRQFDAVAATQVVIEARSQNIGGTNRAVAQLPWDSPDRLGRLNGVEHAALIASVNIGENTVTAVPVNDPSAAAALSTLVMAASSDLVQAVRGEIVTGRFFDAGHDERADRVVVLGSRAAERLGVHRVDNQPSIFIGEDSYAVIGIVDGVQRRTDLLDSVIMPIGTARADFDLAAAEQVQVTIAVGAGPVVGRQAPIALDPETEGENFSVQVPPTLSGVQESVQADINAVFLALGGVALLVGGLGIANVTLLSVMERVGEIGLRRALGATRRNIGSQFMVESVVIGLLGGLIGASLGVTVVVVVCLVQQWTPILDNVVVVASALLGGVIGLIAGCYPALKAASIEPITALRGGI